MLWNALLLALREIRRNLMRSTLTMLGIVIGVASVVVMVNLGSGATAQVSAQIASLGSNLLMVRTGQRLGFGQRSEAKDFHIGDVEAVASEVGGIAAVAPAASQAMTAIYGNRNWSTTITGSDNNFFPVGNWTLAKGREFSSGELRAGASVCILGDSVRKELFGSQQALNEKLRINKLSCQVIGLLAAKGQSAGGRNQDDLVMIPLRAFWRRVAGNQDVQMMYVSARAGVSTAKVQRDIELLLRERRHIAENEDDDFNVHDMKEVAEALTGTTRVLTTLLGAVAAVSLLVGGIGIMNIMLVSVTERTREIGIRLAIGALEREVLLQFLVEAVVLSSFGGLLGILLAIATTYVLATLLGMPVLLDPGTMLLAFLFSAAVGVIFGFFPARKAARQDPIEALRYE
ncbi:MAG: ABC transporter permease [Gammaproteobacteria bacterium]|nr:ABC transporter permease [Gammaproteobacteria bacterium]MCP5417760.1 ABC transporter permease [Chromatiaceae bacterium]